MKKFLCATLLLFAFHFYSSQEWELVSESSKGSFYMKKEKINGYGNPKVWVKGTLKESYYYEGNKKVTVLNPTMLLLYEFNCSDSSTRLISNILYDSNGVLLDSYNNNFSEWENVVPGSVGESELKFVCKYIQ